MQLIDYLPLYFKNIKEFTAMMAAEQPEMTALYKAIKDYTDNQFYDSLTPEGCSRWESILGIEPEGGATLEQRRAAIKSKAADIPAYTFQRVHDLMETIFGEDGFVMEEERVTYTLRLWNLTGDRTKWLTAIDLLEKMVPVNIIIDQGSWSGVEFEGPRYGMGVISYPEVRIMNDEN